MLAPFVLLVCAIHEIQILFVPLHMALVLLVSRTAKAARAARRPLAALVSVALVALAFTLVFRGTPDMAQRICASWSGIAPIDCTAIAGLGFDFLPALAVDGANLPTPAALARFALAALLSLLPAATIVLTATAERRRAFPPALLTLALAPLPLLFYLGWDWGRWLHLIALSAVALLLAPPQTSRAPAANSPLAAALVWLAAIAYVASWKLRHCCELASIDGGLFATFAGAVEIVAGGR